MPELSLEDKLQVTFEQTPEMDRNSKYYLFHFSDTDNQIVKIGDALSERQQKWFDGKHHLICEYSNKRSRWELSVPSKG